MKRRFLPYIPCLIISLFMLLTLTQGCSDGEKMIVGTWSHKGLVDGIKSNSVFIFNADGTFIQRLVTKESNTLGFEVRGTWEMNATDQLTLSYQLSTLKGLPTDDFYDPAGGIMRQYLERMRSQINQIMSDGATYDIEFIDDGEYMNFTSGDGTERYTRIKRSKSATAQGDDTPAPASSLDVISNLPTSGSIHQFDILSERRLTESDLAGLNPAHLRILRNAIYAMHDYSFDSADLQQYFGGFYDYTSRSKDVNLNSIELANVALIKSLE